MIRSDMLRLSAWRADTLPTLALVAAFLFAALVGGVVIASGKPVLIDRKSVV